MGGGGGRERERERERERDRHINRETVSALWSLEDSHTDSKKKYITSKKYIYKVQETQAQRPSEEHPKCKNYKQAKQIHARNNKDKPKQV